MEEKYGIIDIGSNTIRLVIYKYEWIGRFHEAENIKVVARLRNYLGADQCLNKDGIDILLHALIHFEEILRHHDVTTVKVVATAAIRQAANHQEIIKAVRGKTHFNIRILTEFEEAYYGYLSVVNSTSMIDGITIDIGGGSTEITHFENRELKHYYSFPFGALSLSNDFIDGDVPTKQEVEALRKHIHTELSQLDWIQETGLTIIGIGGSARNMAQVDQALKSYPIAGLHQYEMSKSDIQNVFNMLTSIHYSDMKKMDGLSEDRADIIIPAIIVFQTLVEQVGAFSFILSRKGLRDGLFYEQLLLPIGIQKFPSVLEESLYELTMEYNIDLTLAMQISTIAKMLFTEFKREYPALAEEDLVTLKQAATLFYLGGYIDAEASSQHTFYVLANRTIDGLMHRERIKLALLASFKSKSVFKQYMKPFRTWFSKVEEKKLRLIGAILKLASALNYTKRNIVTDIHLNKHEQGFVLDVVCKKDGGAEFYQANKQLKHVAKAIKEDIEINFINEEDRNGNRGEENHRCKQA